MPLCACIDEEIAQELTMQASTRAVLHIVVRKCGGRHLTGGDNGDPGVSVHTVWPTTKRHLHRLVFPASGYCVPQARCPKKELGNECCLCHTPRRRGRGLHTTTYITPHTTVGPLLDHWWTTGGPLVGHPWPIVGPLLDHRWAIVGPRSDHPSSIGGPLLDQCWTTGGPLLDHCWAIVGPPSATLAPPLNCHWPTIGPPLGHPWATLGPPLDHQ